MARYFLDFNITSFKRLFRSFAYWFVITAIGYYYQFVTPFNVCMLKIIWCLVLFIVVNL
jgi:hypothetical protein